MDTSLPPWGFLFLSPRGSRPAPPNARQRCPRLAARYALPPSDTRREDPKNLRRLGEERDRHRITACRRPPSAYAHVPESFRSAYTTFLRPHGFDTLASLASVDGASASSLSREIQVEASRDRLCRVSLGRYNRRRLPSPQEPHASNQRVARTSCRFDLAAVWMLGQRHPKRRCLDGELFKGLQGRRRLHDGLLGRRLRRLRGLPQRCHQRRGRCEVPSGIRCREGELRREGHVGLVRALFNEGREVRGWPLYALSEVGISPHRVVARCSRTLRDSDARLPALRACRESSG